MEYSHVFPWQVITRSAGLNLSVKLDHAIDIEALRRDAGQVLSAFPKLTASNVHHNGGWTGVALMSVDGEMSDDRTLGRHECSPTAALERAPYIREIVGRLSHKIGRVRLLTLAPGEAVTWHFDRDDSIDQVWSRIHLPIWSNPGAQLQIGHEDLFWRPGEMWYGEFSFPHRLRNRGAEPRTHLVCDLVVDDRTRSLIPDWYHAQKEPRARWRPVVQRLCKIHQLATFRTKRTHKFRQRIWPARPLPLPTPPPTGRA
jgi:hypothetical protein